MKELKRVLISGGGTGGHINPALAIADEIKKRYPNAEINFVGAKGRMEMEKVPKAGYNIEGLWISGIERKLTSTKNLTFPFKLITSLVKAGRLLRKYKPEVVIGVGGFASGPLLYRAALKGIPTLIQEQNSFPGITNRILAGHVKKVCAGFPGLERWFPESKIVETGNPLRSSVLELLDGANSDTSSAKEHFNLAPDQPVVFVMGGSLGAVSLNEAVKNIIEQNLSTLPYQLLWQCGQRFLAENESWLNTLGQKHPEAAKNVKCVGFIDRMDLAYSSAEIIASRAGAMSISELALVAKPTILIPSPHVTEDHQTKNALSLVDREAAVLVKDKNVVETLGDEINRILHDSSLCEKMSLRLREAAKPEAIKVIVNHVEELL